MNRNTFGVLLVTGAQTHQEMYAAAFAADQRCKLIALTDQPDVDRRQRQLNERLTKKLAIPHVDDLDQALARKDVHVVSICAPPERRAAIAVKCAQAGKHLYLDKSLAPSVAEAHAIAAAVRKANVKSQMFSFVTQPWAAEVKRALQQGMRGTLRAIHADVFFAKGKTGTAKLGGRRVEEFPPKRHQLVAAKREFDNVGVYPITLISWLTGKRFETIFGVTGNYFFREHQDNNVEDFGAVCGTLQGGIGVTIAAGRYGWQSHAAGGINRLTVITNEETLVIDANRPRLELSNDEPAWTPPPPHPQDPMAFWPSTTAAMGGKPKRAWLPIGPPAKSDASAFIDCLQAGHDSEMPASRALHATEVLLAAYQSAASGEVVRLAAGH